jgi:integrase
VTNRRGKGEGAIRKRQDGRWEARVELGWIEGKRKRLSIYGRTRADVAKKLRDSSNRRDEGTLVVDQRLTIEKWLQHWINTVLVGRVANGTLQESTLNSYEDTVRLHLIPGLGKHRLGKLTPAHIDAFIAARRESYSANSLRIMRTTLRKALHDAERAGLVSRNAATLSEPVRVDRRSHRFLTAAEARALLDATAMDRLAALYVVVLCLGLREGEALALRWDDIDFDRRTVTIRRSLKRLRNRPLSDGSYPNNRKTRLAFGTPKSPASWRTQTLPAVAVGALRDHRHRQTIERLAATCWGDLGLVFATPIGTPIDPANFQKRFTAACRDAGLGHRNPHQLRHSAATLMLAEGIPLHEVRDVLGHSSISVTKDIYGHVASERRQAAADAIDQALSRTSRSR